VYPATRPRSVIGNDNLALRSYFLAKCLNHSLNSIFSGVQLLKLSKDIPEFRERFIVCNTINISMRVLFHILLQETSVAKVDPQL
jgi:hypothetical protein